MKTRYWRELKEGEKPDLHAIALGGIILQPHHCGEDQPKPATGCTCNKENRGAAQHSSHCLAANRPPKPASGEWTVVDAYRDQHYTIMCGDNCIADDVSWKIVNALVDAHNAALAAQKRDLWDKISCARIEADNWKGLYEKNEKQLAAANRKGKGEAELDTRRG